ncbi:MAG: phage shock protein operon transcriptional activator [Gammaproteobacteria bacterium]|nr:phage shock protein operon transcriptional activator [Gammaproteobacteria bacterium]NNF62281.1 phage shock protein operon transcriptional activator [Gammaproteobacteria bacterium]NNM20874.1 phage shock protein operon transcriptional activator [Gammaproteobacteria bacterium]
MPSIIGEAPAFVALLEQVSQAAPMSKPVLTIGERGTGKELIASRLHYLSGRWDEPLIKLNCASLTESLLESELFGHEAGAFTGAAARHVGRFERADGGTLFLDELATIPRRMQEKILRVIEYGEFERVGGSETIAVDVRIVGATNENLPILARTGAFRADLLDRLAFDVLVIPPLRARREDILSLAEHFAVTITAELGRPFFPGFAEPAIEALLDHEWPGNVRELKNVVERSVYRWEETETPVAKIILNPFESPYLPRTRALTLPTRAGSESPQTPAPRRKKTHSLPLDFKNTVRDFEVSLIDTAMKASRYNQRHAAEQLGLTYHQLRGCLRKYDLVEKYGRARGDDA